MLYTEKSTTSVPDIVCVEPHKSRFASVGSVIYTTSTCKTEPVCFHSCWRCSVRPDEFKGHSLLQAAREADMAKAKKSLVLEIINFKHPHTHETALVSTTHTHTESCSAALMLTWRLTCVRVLALCSSVTAPEEETGDGAAVEEGRQREREEQRVSNPLVYNTT